MTTRTHAVEKVDTSLAAILGAAFVGAMIVFFAGHVQSSTLHEAAHDTRHATGFPCH